MENFSAPSSIDLFHLLFQLTIEHRIKIHLLTLLKIKSTLKQTNEHKNFQVAIFSMRKKVIVEFF
jgi:hypothetical protein